MSTFPSMVEIVPEASIGIAAVEHFEVNKTDAMISGFRIGEYVSPGMYARLRVNGRLMMTDTRMEHMTNYKFVRRARGNVLVAGLGLGMILHPVLEDEEVTSVTVIEKYADVIALVGPTVKHSKLTIIHADVYEWKPAKGTKFDTIYFDIWAEQSTDTLKDMAKLHMRFRPYKTLDAWMESWRRDSLKSKKRQQRNGGRW